MELSFDGGMESCLGKDCPSSCCEPVSKAGARITEREFRENYGGDTANFPDDVDWDDVSEYHSMHAAFRVKNCLGEEGCKFRRDGILAPSMCRTWPALRSGGVSPRCPVSAQLSEEFLAAAREELKRNSPDPFVAFMGRK